MLSRVRLYESIFIVYVMRGDGKNLLEHTIYACTYGRRSLCVWNKKKDERTTVGG